MAQLQTRFNHYLQIKSFGITLSTKIIKELCFWYAIRRTNYQLS